MNIETSQKELDNLVKAKKDIESKIKVIKDEATKNGLLIQKNKIIQNDMIYCVEYNIATVDKYVGERGCLCRGSKFCYETNLEEVQYAKMFYDLIKDMKDGMEIYKVYNIFIEEHKQGKDAHEGVAYEGASILDNYSGDTLDIFKFNVEADFNLDNDNIFEINELGYCDGHEEDIMQNSFLRISKRPRSFLKTFKQESYEDSFDPYLTYTAYGK